MIVHLALGIEAACATAWIGALLIDASQVLCTLRADHALGPACGWSTEVANLAAACGMALDCAAYAVRSARIGLTDADWSHRSALAAHEWIALEATRTTACGQVVDHSALGVGATGAGARIAAVLLDAGQ